MDTNKHAPICCSSRLFIAFQTLLGVMVIFLIRGSMGMAIVCMTTPIKATYSHGHNMCGITEQNKTTSLGNVCQEEPEFDYDKETQGYILGSFFLLHFLTPVPFGWLAGRYGGKIVLGWVVFLSSLISLLTPIAARTHLGLLITSRVLMGSIQSGLWPASQVILSNWAPPLDRTIMSGLTVLGHCFGSLVGHPISAVLCTYGFDSGWPCIFYVYGSIGVCWCMSWVLTVNENPILHKRISNDERSYIADSLRATGDINKKVTGIPWLRILRSMPVWSLVVSIVCFDWGIYIYLFNIPSYMKEILQLDILQSGGYAALPFVGYTIVTMVSLYLPDLIRRRKYLSTAHVRKLFNSIGSFIPAVFLILVTRFDSSPTVALMLLALGFTATGCLAGGVALANSLDIAGRYSGVVIGIVIIGESLIGIFANLTVGFITTDKTQAQWNLIFYITSGLHVFGGVFFLIFASGELQPWAAVDDKGNDITLSHEIETKEVIAHHI